MSDKCLRKGERSRMAPRHALSKLSCTPLISAAWTHNPWRSLRAQVSPVCPQISFVILRTPCSGSAAPSTETVVLVFVKLFAGMVSSNVWPGLSFSLPYEYIPMKFLSLTSAWCLYINANLTSSNTSSSVCYSFSWWKISSHGVIFLKIVPTVIKLLSGSACNEP